MRLLPVAVVLVLSVGCVTVTEGDRELIDQNKKAAAIIEKVVGEPEAVQAAVDIRKNSEVLQAGLGAPAIQRDYSPDVSESSRRKATEQHENPWWKMLLTSAAGLALGGGATRFLAAWFPALASGKVGTALTAVIEGVARFRQTAERNPDRTLTVDDLLSVLASLQDRAGVRDFVRSYATRIETRLAGATTRMPTLPPSTPTEPPSPPS